MSIVFFLRVIIFLVCSGSVGMNIFAAVNQTAVVKEESKMGDMQHLESKSVDTLSPKQAIIEMKNGEKTLKKSIGNNQQLVNINTGNLATLSQVNGLGEKKAASIIAYRDKHGPFHEINALLSVPGIGEKLLNRLRGQLKI